MNLQVHAVEPRSRANGPGARFVVWLQGCTLGCPGCFNPATHAAGEGERTPVAEIVAAILAEGEAIEGVTISGGEPFEQPEGLAALCAALRAEAPRLSILVFSGLERAEIEATPLGPAILAALDVLIDGRYVAGQRAGGGLRGSTNQVIHLLTARYDAATIAATPPAEVTIGPDGEVKMSGVAPLRLRR